MIFLRVSENTFYIYCCEKWVWKHSGSSYIFPGIWMKKKKHSHKHQTFTIHNFINIWVILKGKSYYTYYISIFEVDRSCIENWFSSLYYTQRNYSNCYYSRLSSSRYRRNHRNREEKNIFLMNGNQLNWKENRQKINKQTSSYAPILFWITKIWTSILW